MKIKEDKSRASCPMEAKQTTRSKQMNVIHSSKVKDANSKQVVVSLETRFRLLLATITTLIYLNSLQGTFVYDDRRAILQNPNVVAPSDDSFTHPFTWLWRVFCRDDFWGTPVEHSGSHKSYRPLVTLTFKLQQLANDWLVANNWLDARQEAIPFHVINLLIHLFVCDLVFQLANTHLPLVWSSQESHYSNVKTSACLLSSKRCNENSTTTTKATKSARQQPEVRKATIATNKRSVQIDTMLAKTTTTTTTNTKRRCASVWRKQQQNASNVTSSTTLTNRLQQTNDKSRQTTTRNYVSSSSSSSSIVLFAADQSKQLNSIACVASLLFACHPIHVEAVASVVGRAELMGAAFALLSLLSTIEFLSTTTRLPIQFANGILCSIQFACLKSSAYALAASLCKENCSTIVLLNLGLVCWFYCKHSFARSTINNTSSSDKEEVMMKIRRCKQTACASLASALIYLCIRLTIGGHMLSNNKLLPHFSRLDNPLYQDARQFCLLNRHHLTTEAVSEVDVEQYEQFCGQANTLAHISRSLWLTRLYLPVFSLKLLVWPQELSYDWTLASIGGLLTSVHDSRATLSFLLYLSTLGFVFYWLYSKYNILLQTTLRRKQAKLQQSDDFNTSVLSKTSDGNESETSSVRSVDTLKSSDSGFASDSSVSSSSLNKIEASEEESSNKENEHAACVKKSITTSKCQKRKVKTTTILTSKHHDKQVILSDQIVCSLVLLIVPYLPASNLLVPVGFLVAERTLYLPSVGYCLLSAQLLCQLAHVLTSTWKNMLLLLLLFFKNNDNIEKFANTNGFVNCPTRKNSTSAMRHVSICLLVLPLLILGAAQTIHRNSHWHDDVSLYSSNLVQSPAKSLANLATLRVMKELLFDQTTTQDGEKGEKETLLNQIELYNAALEHEPYSAELHYNLALSMQNLHSKFTKLPSLHSRAADDYSTTLQQQQQQQPADLVEHHYKLALKLRPNFPLAALNLVAWLTSAWRRSSRGGGGESQQLVDTRHALGLIQNCAIKMNPLEGKNFRQHVRAQIECLISGARMLLEPTSDEQRRRDDVQLVGNEQTATTTTTAASCSEQKNEATRLQAVEEMMRNHGKHQQRENVVDGQQKCNESNAEQQKCRKVFEWMKLAREKVKQIDDDDDDVQQTEELIGSGAAQTRSFLRIAETPNNQLGDLSKQMALINWLESRCCHEPSCNNKRHLLGNALKFASTSSWPLDAQLYFDYANIFGLDSDKLKRAIHLERHKSLHHTTSQVGALLAGLARRSSKAAGALEWAKQASDLEPQNANYLTLVAQLAYETRQLNVSELFYRRAVELLSNQLLLFNGSCTHSATYTPKPSTHQVIAMRTRQLASALTNYGAVLQINGQLDEAAKQYRRALDCDPSNLVAATNFAQVRRRLRSSTKAPRLRR